MRVVAAFPLLVMLMGCDNSRHPGPRGSSPSQSLPFSQEPSPSPSSSPAASKSDNAQGEIQGVAPSAGLSRWNPSGLSSDWFFEGSAFQALANQSAIVSADPVYRLNHPTFGYLFTTNVAERDSAIMQYGFSSDGTAFFVPKQSQIPIHRFQKADKSYFYTAQKSEGDAAQFKYEGVAFHAIDATQAQTPGVINVARYKNKLSSHHLLSGGVESPYQVGAYYFDMWSPKAQDVIGATQSLYGRPQDWWGGVRDFYGLDSGVPRNTRQWAGDWSFLKPVLGYYDVRNVATVEKHITQAADGGLSFFSFYWYWSQAAKKTRFGEGITSFLAASNRSRLKFTVSLYAHPWDGDMKISPEDAPLAVQELVNLFKEPNYLRTLDGRPFFTIGDSRNLMAGTLNSVQDFVSLLKQTSQAQLGVQPFVALANGVSGWDTAVNTEGVTCLAAGVHDKGALSYQDLIKSSQQLYSALRSSQKIFSPCLTQNFDERSRQDLLIKDREAIRYLTGKTDDLLRQNIWQVKTIADQSAHPAGKIVTIYAWNEWHEGGILEPNVKTGALDLNIVTDVFGLPRNPSACLDGGSC
jgi:hypothetical protein